ncbi:MAG: aryl-sulfate sulfotransferase [Chloroflexota bacterium]|nr:aryl-sulfate sulfotransferase [Chloroflexota bacterium]
MNRNDRCKQCGLVPDAQHEPGTLVKSGRFQDQEEAAFATLSIVRASGRAILSIGTFGLLVMLLWASLSQGSLSLSREMASLQYLSPRPGAMLVSRETTISVRHGDPIAGRTVIDGLFQVEGAKSGLLDGETILADDGRTVIFAPDKPFSPGERVSVTLRSGLRTIYGERVHGLSWRFSVSAKRMTEPNDRLMEDLILSELPGEQLEVERMPVSASPAHVTLPADFPNISVTVPASNTAEGLILVSHMTFRFWEDRTFLLILDDQGEPVYYKASTPGKMLWDFQKQPNGMLSYYDQVTHLHHVMNADYQEVGTYRPGNGYWGDFHDFWLSPGGDSMYLIYDEQQIDMSQIVPGGVPTATVIGLIVQELDPSRNVVFEWRSWDHFNITDTTVSLTAPTIRYVHGNALERDLDGNILISSRNLDEITKIDRQTGEMIWRFGGKNNQFTVLNDHRPFSHQHDIVVLPNGHYTLFDNGNDLDPPYSRGLEYELDEAARTARVVDSYRHTPDIFAMGMGSTRRLPNGNLIIGWGANLTVLTEFRPDGSTALEMMFDRATSYRAQRVPWQGWPTWSPTLVNLPAGSGSTLYVSWNGATEIASYRVDAGLSANPDTFVPVGLVDKSGFETEIDISDLIDDYCYFRVMPIDNQGQETQYSETVLAANSSCDLRYYLPLTSASG